MTHEEAITAHVLASKAWDVAVHDCTIRLLREDESMDVYRAKMLGEDDARREHAALWEAIWTTNEQERLAAAALQEQRSQEMIAAQRAGQEMFADWLHGSEQAAP